MATYLVTGSSRGIGLGIVTYLLSLPPDKVKTVIATAREPANSAALISLANSPEGRGRIALVPLDVSNSRSVDSAALQVSRCLKPNTTLDVLINNAGILPSREGIDELSDERLMQNFNTNAMGAHRVIRSFYPLMGESQIKKIVSLGATLSSLALSAESTNRKTVRPAAGYAISKTALNMINMQWALALKDSSFIVTLICPGWVVSSIGGPNAELSTEEAVKAIVNKIDVLDSSSNGKFFRVSVVGKEKSEFMQCDGSEIPW